MAVYVLESACVKFRVAECGIVKVRGWGETGSDTALLNVYQISKGQQEGSI
jgi:hypothetical protein